MISRIDKAVKYAMAAHEGQTRKSICTPYLVHVLEVQRRLAYWDIDKVEIHEAAILHDTIEDTSVSYDDLVSEFGQVVADIVSEVTLLHELTGSEKKKAKWKFLQGFKNASDDAVVLKFADRYENVHDFLMVGRDKYASKYALMAYGVYQALLSRPIVKNGEIFSNLEDIDKVVKQTYSNISIFDKDIEKKIEKIVL